MINQYECDLEYSINIVISLIWKLKEKGFNLITIIKMGKRSAGKDISEGDVNENKDKKHIETPIKKFRKFKEIEEVLT